METCPVNRFNSGMQVQRFLKVVSKPQTAIYDEQEYQELTLADLNGSIRALIHPASGTIQEGTVLKVRGTVIHDNSVLTLLVDMVRELRPEDTDDPEYTKLLPLGEAKQFTKVERYLLVRSAEQRTDKKGNLYLDINLADKTGEINGKLWNNTPAPASGKIVFVKGVVDVYNDRNQLRIEALKEITTPSEGMLKSLIPCAPLPSSVMLKEICDTIDSFAGEDLRRLVYEMLRMVGEEKLDYFPAAQRLHHAEFGGLLHHTTGMLNTAQHILEAYPFLNGDLLKAGVILHDLAKTAEMKSDEMGNVTDYTRDGLLIGHLVRGVSMLGKAADTLGISRETEIVVLLEHMILSHHGVPEYGSPRLPMFPEAEVLHWIDLLDARMNELEGIMNRTPQGAFSEKIWSLDNRRIYHPYYESVHPTDVTE